MAIRLANLLPRRQQRTASGPLLLNQHNVYVLPTRWGWSFVGLILLFLLISTNYNNNLGFLLSFLLTSMGLTSAVHGQRNLAGLTLRSSKGGSVFLGEKLPFALHLTNATARPRFALTVYAQACDGNTLALLNSASDASLPLCFRPERRGWYHPDSIVLETRYPLGIFRVWSRFTFNWQGLVYPVPAKDSKPFPTTPGSEGTGANTGDEDFTSFRAYQAGDSLKHVHWKGYAKGRGLFTRVYQQGSQEQLWLDWAFVDEIGVEAKLSRLCRWVLDAERSGFDYGLRLPDRVVSPKHGQAHRDTCLEALALHHSHGSRP